MAFARLKEFGRDESGAALIEMTVTVTMFLVILFGVVEFSHLFYQWNAATKAVQFGARLAAVSDPVASDLSSLTGVGGSVLPGAAMPAFDRVCTSDHPTGATGQCTGVNSYDFAAMQTLIYGRGNGTLCNGTGNNIGMCNLFPNITPQNVRVRYQNNGLGYAGRPSGYVAYPGAPVPTITVSIRNFTFNYIFLKGLVPGLTAVSMPGLNTTITGEDLRKVGS